MFQPNLTGAGIFIIENYKNHIVATLFGNHGRSYSEPGGRIDPGESPEVAACRETREETANLIRIFPQELQQYSKPVIHNQYMAYIIYLKDINSQLHRHNVHKIFQDCGDHSWKENSSITRIPLRTLVEVALRNTHYATDLQGGIVNISDRTLGIVRKSIQILNNISFSLFPLQLHVNMTVASRMSCLIGTYSCTVKPIQPPAQINLINQTPTKYRYGVYIVPKLKPDNQKLHDCNPKWGGLHVTLLGFSSKHPDLRRNIKKTSRAGMNKWRMDTKTIEVRNNAVYFRSATLDKVANHLSKSGFQKIKGKFFSGLDWHITFADCQIPHNIDEILKRVSWSFVIVKEENNGTYSWVKKYKVHRIL